MGKKSKNIKGDQVCKQISLVEQHAELNDVRPTVHHEKDEIPDDKFVVKSLGQKITKLSKQQLQEDYEAEASDALHKVSLSSKSIRKKPKSNSRNFNGDSDVEEEDNLAFSFPDNIDACVQQLQDQLDINVEDEDAFGDFKCRDNVTSEKDLLRDRIANTFTEVQTQIDNESVAEEECSEQDFRIGKKIGALLKRYRSGPLPKQLKKYPLIRDWEKYIFLTDPGDWSAAAVYQVTRIFVALQPAHILQRYLELIVLPRFRDDVSFYKKVNFHIYQTLCKAIFKPAAFHKGIVMPLCDSAECTLREAIILGSVIARKKIPILHSAATVSGLAQMSYSGGSSILMRIYLDKKYQLPYRVIDDVVNHFLRFEREQKEYPVLWHQCLLTFIQHYKEEITHEQKDAIMKLIRNQFHHQITDEIRREIINSKRSRKTPEAVESMDMK